MSDSTATLIQELTRWMEAEMSKDRREARWVRIGAAIGGAALVAVAVVTMVAVLSVLTSVKQQTSPAQVKRNQQILAKIEADVVLCIANHNDRVIDAAFHRPVPALRKGCPADPAD